MPINKEMYLGLDDKHLSDYQGFKATKKALEALKELQNDALLQGLSIDIASSFRSFERQFLIFDEKYQGKRVVLDANEQPLDIKNFSPEAKCEAILRFSAIPGMSRHHFGTDFDIYSKKLLPKNQKLKLTAYEYDKGKYFYPLKLYLEKNLQKFGFIEPFLGNPFISYEPWHISYISEAQEFIKAFDIDEEISLLNQHEREWTPYIIKKIKSLNKKLLGVL